MCSSPEPNIRSISLMLTVEYFIRRSKRDPAGWAVRWQASGTTSRWDTCAALSCLSASLYAVVRLDLARASR